MDGLDSPTSPYIVPIDEQSGLIGVSPTFRRRTTEGDTPLVSVIIACWNSARFLQDCLTSVTRQSLREIEIIIVDDASDDGSQDIIQLFARADTRIVPLLSECRGGPAQARNRALDVCRGRWIAVFDSDDLMHPNRLAIMVQAGESGSADIVADNQILFRDDVGAFTYPLLTGDLARKPSTITCSDYVMSNSLDGKQVPFGYLKPLFRRTVIESNRIRYDQTLSIAEDYDFVFRLLLAGASFKLIPSLTYFYRRHSLSTSFRLSREALIRMLAADMKNVGHLDHLVTPGIKEAIKARRLSIQRLVTFTDVVQRLKCRDWWQAGRMIAAHPRTILSLFRVARDRLRSVPRRSSETIPSEKVACVLSRQRVTGATNGSSVYLLGICNALRNDGWKVDLVCPSPAMFGRWPVIRLQREMDVFRSISIRGAVRVGSFVIATNPAIAGRAGLAIADRLLRRVGLHLGALVRKAPHAIAVPSTDADKLFVTRRSRQPSLVVADYAFLSEMIPFTMSPRARTAIVMHDLFSAQKTDNRPVSLCLEREMELLAAADIVVAIQREEADIVASHLGKDRVIIVPMAAQPALHAQSGDGRTVMFVGSNTLPNVDGLEWLLADIWPTVIQRIPDARLVVVGSVCQSVRTQRRDVRFVGQVESLADLYRDAAVIVSPLRSGSGLKVKLVEALANGKAMVGTSVTFQGVEHLAGTAAMCTDDAAAFSDAVVTSLQDEMERRRLGQRALEAAAAEFSPGRCYSDFLRFAAEGQAPRDETLRYDGGRAPSFSDVGIAGL